MPDATKLVEEQNRLWKQMQEARDRATEAGEPLDARAREAWDKAEKRLSEISEDLDRFTRMANMEQVDRTQIITTGQPEVDATRDTTPDEEQRYADAFTTYLRGGMDVLEPAERQLLRTGFSKHEERRRAPPRALPVGSWSRTSSSSVSRNPWSSSVG
jgi:hypothetical protein